MPENETRTYVINDDFEIVSYSKLAKENYPNLEVGKKCYKAVRGLENPCLMCPVNNKRQQYATFFNPIRRKYEILETVEMYDENGNRNHAVTFSDEYEDSEYENELKDIETELTSIVAKESCDNVTGGLSEYGFIEKVSRVLKISSPSDEFAIIYMDINDIKIILDMFGYTCVNELICAIYEKIKKSECRPLVLARLMQADFVCLVHKSDLSYDSVSKLSRLKWNFNGRELIVSMRCGILAIDDRNLPVSTMVERARIAKDSIDYKHPKSYAIFNEEMLKNSVNQDQIVEEFENSLANEEFQVYYQPIIDPRTEDVVYAEALTRWIHPILGEISPKDFIPALEKKGYITKLDSYISGIIYESIANRHLQNDRIVPISINLSTMDLYDNELREYFVEKLRSGSVPNGYIGVDVKESTVTASGELCDEFVKLLKDNGGTVFLDNSGSKFLPFSMVQQNNFDILKIDKKLIELVDSSLVARNRIELIINICHELDIKVLGDGVEKKETYEYLRSKGCDLVQGYYTARPMPEEEFYTFVDEIRSNINENKSHECTGAISYSNAKLNEKTSTRGGVSLKSELELLKMIVDSTDRVIVLCDIESMEILHLNKKAKEIAKNKTGDYEGKNCHEYFSGTDKLCEHCPKTHAGGVGGEVVETFDGKHKVFIQTQMIDFQGRKLCLALGNEISNNVSAAKYTETLNKFVEADKDRRTDFLTGLRNRMDLFDCLQKVVGGINEPIEAMYMLDIDDFKSYNDTYGHIAGDDCLKKISSALLEYARENSITFFRYGGEEILGISSAGNKKPKAMAAEILDEIRRLRITRDDGKGLYVTVSLGFTTDNSRYEKMIDKADKAMYQAKAMGKNRCVCFEIDKSTEQ